MQILRKISLCIIPKIIKIIYLLPQNILNIIEQYIVGSDEEIATNLIIES